MLTYIRTTRPPHWISQDEVKYSLVVGGLGWPWGEKPGQLVILGVEQRFDYDIKGHKVKVLAVRDGASLNNLYRAYIELNVNYQPMSWLADTADSANLQYLMDLADQKQQRFSLDWCPQLSLTVYLSLIEELGRKTKKIIHFGKFDQFGKYVMGMGAEERGRPIKEHPLIAALGYPLYEINETLIPGEDDEDSYRPTQVGQSSVTGY